MNDFQNFSNLSKFTNLPVFQVFTQQKGLENLYSMLNYCLDSKICRRSLIAEHFDEVWESTLCNKMCDHCQLVPNVKQIELSPHCRHVLTPLRNSRLKLDRCI